MTVPPQHLSIILTTSAIKSHPSTFILDSALSSIFMQPSLINVHIYIICDGAKISPHDQNKYKSGIITQETFENYTKFKDVIKEKYGTNKNRFTIIERDFRCGFAQNIRYVMAEYTKTQHVMIYQHDYIIEKVIPFDQVVQMMRKNSDQINYLTFMNLSYTNIIPKMESIPKVRAFLLNLLNKQENYNFIVNIKQFTRQLAQFFNKKFGKPLMPLNFWYDKLHIASRRFYLEVVFNEAGNYDPNRGKNMKTVTFVQDTFGHCMKWTVDQQPETLLNQWKAYILWADKSVFYHLSGRTFMTQEATECLKIKVERKQSQGSDVSIGDFEQIIQTQEKNTQKLQSHL